MVEREIAFFEKRAIEKKDLGFDEAMRIWEIGMEKPFLVMAKAFEIRKHFKGKETLLCMIVNAKSGLCAEDCKFCAQSIYYSCDVETYPLLKAEEILERAEEAKKKGAHMFGIVTSGKKVEDEKEWDTILSAVKKISEMGIKPCASLGFLDEENAKRLKDAGLFRYHHNLETSKTYFPFICSTHSYEEKLQTIRNAKKAGLSVCSGGIIGMGESLSDRIEFALQIREADPDSVPINILNPRPGTPLAQVKPPTPMEILLTISIFRFLLPDKDIKLCAGKEIHLRQLLPLALVAGCNSLMTGNYLTTRGRDPDLDKEMIEDLSLSWRIDG